MNLTDQEKREVVCIWRLVGALFVIVGAVAVLSVLSWMTALWFNWLTLVVGGLCLLLGLVVLLWATVVSWWRSEGRSSSWASSSTNHKQRQPQPQPEDKL